MKREGGGVEGGRGSKGMIKVSVTQAGILMNPCLPLNPDTKPHVVPGAPDTDSIRNPLQTNILSLQHIYSIVTLPIVLLKPSFSNFNVH